LKSVSGSEKRRLDHDGNQQRSIAIVPNDGLNTCTQPGTPLIKALSIMLCETVDVMMTRHLCYCEILQK